MGNNSDLSVRNDNLKPWQPGQSGNPSGRPKGSKNLKTIIRRVLEDESVYDELDNWGQRSKTRTPIQAIVVSLASKALDGDARAAEILFKYGFDPKAPDEEDKINRVLVQFMTPKGPVDYDDYVKSEFGKI